MYRWRRIRNDSEPDDSPGKGAAPRASSACFEHEPRSPTRLLTLFGMGGPGKTRPSLQVAAEVRDDFTDGI